MNCLVARERLPEHALATLGSRERSAVDRHLAWCAACRKEVGELEEAAAVLGFAAAPAEPVPAFEDRVVRAVQAQAFKESASHRRLRFAVGAAVLATVLAVGGLGWGAVAVMAKRPTQHQQFEPATNFVPAKMKRLWGDLLTGISPRDARTSTADLAAQGAATGEGWGVVMVLPDKPDVAGVNVSNLDEGSERGPYSVEVVSAGGHAMTLGRIQEIDDHGSGQLFEPVHGDLSGARAILVRDARGVVVLRGSLVASTSS